ncbi:ferric-dicitrate binding protein FerR, regulates iron transport through sigma-19 [Chitinophaga eiseniae]|uniref:Ferric-dicitrate binding protein FerR, regulates iron transport through sigma-19 n=1 Tax=Chitinophaga eiseniae TaxID=634771 RepID=A0A1T4TK85_9BACT|nr:FecR domain-containing protein [Chitinophaga eiseniae]SKA40718.1 ferric-dicitrate binding protein FerR, regulates iron transport through sigma-19 [Chitinophaga eiseniae]
MLPENIWEIVARKLSGEASEAEERELQALMDQRPELRETILAAEALQLTPQVEHAAEDMRLHGWQQLQQEIGETPAPARSNIRRLLIRTGWAAAIVVMGLLSYNWWMGHTWKTLATTSGKDSLLLPDGSRVFLNANTTLRYARNYGNGSRALILDSGEAYFEVAQQQNSPFTVHVAAVDIKVLGTAFNVHRAANGQVDIFVTSGRIRAVNKSGKSMVLSAGAQATSSDKTPDIRPVTTSTENVLAWKTNHLVFNRMPLSDVAVVLANYYQLDVVVTDSVVSHKVLQATFNNKPIDEVLDVIGKALNVNITKKQKTLEFHQ